METTSLLQSHPFSRALIAKGIEVEDYKFSPQSQWLLGYKFVTDGLEIVYNFDSADSIRIILFRRLYERHGVSSALRDFTRLLFELSDSAYGIEYVTGVVRHVEHEGNDRLSPPRIALFYKKYLGASCIEIDNGAEVIRGSLSHFREVWKGSCKRLFPV